MTDIAGHLKWDVYIVYIIGCIIFVGICCFFISCLYIVCSSKNFTASYQLVLRTTQLGSLVLRATDTDIPSNVRITGHTITAHKSQMQQKQSAETTLYPIIEGSEKLEEGTELEGEKHETHVTINPNEIDLQSAMPYQMKDMSCLAKSRKDDFAATRLISTTASVVIRKSISTENAADLIDASQTATTRISTSISVPIDVETYDTNKN